MGGRLGGWEDYSKSKTNLNQRFSWSWGWDWQNLKFILTFPLWDETDFFYWNPFSRNLKGEVIVFPQNQNQNNMMKIIIFRPKSSSSFYTSKMETYCGKYVYHFQIFVHDLGGGNLLRSVPCMCEASTYEFFSNSFMKKTFWCFTSNCKYFWKLPFLCMVQIWGDCPWDELRNDQPG